MTGQDKAKTCWGCIHRASRIRGSTPRTWCKRYHIVTNMRCEDYRHKQRAIAAAMRFVKSLGGK